MNKHLQTTKRLSVLLFILLLGFVGTQNAFAQISEGAISGGVFTINSYSKVVFSQGNLQYIGSASTPYWKFADHQWDYLGITTGQNSNNQNVDRDLFGWGTSGYNHGAVCYQPWNTSTSTSDYYAYGDAYHNLTGQADWGYNAISNGGNTENSGWRTLKKAEWQYVFNTRSASTVNGTANARYAKAKVANVQGVILFPDSYTHPAGVAQPIGINDTGNTGLNGNNYSADDFALMQAAGAVFLPVAGYRNGTSVNLVGYIDIGYYWSASYCNTGAAYSVSFSDYGLNPEYYSGRYYGCSVRLVCPAENYSFNINATPNPTEGGAVSGGGTYTWRAECTLTATPSAGYAFARWMENGTVVSTYATFTFTVTGDRSLVARFVQVQEGNITFADANVKALCVSNWDTNGDGELSYAEAANVKSIGYVFKNNTTIHSFNELQYFISLGSIGEQAFYGCTELTQITIPESVCSVGSKAFWNCPALQTVRFNAVNCTSMQTTYNNQTYSVFSSDASGGTPAVKSVVIANGVTRIPDYAFKNCAQIYPGMTIRSTVTEIGAHAFENCSSMTTLSFQNNSTLATIGDCAFSGCSALNKALNIPNSVSILGQFAFYGCVAIPSLTIGTGMKTIGGYAFWNCPAMATVHFNATNCTQMDTPVSSGSFINYYSVFNSGTSINGATSIVTLTIGDNVTRIPDYAFRNSTNMTSAITIPNATTYMGQYAFFGAHSQELTIGEGVTSIGYYAFWNCPYLAMVHFNATNCTQMHTQTSSSSQYVYYSVFNSETSINGATSIVTLTIGDNVTGIPAYAFRNSSNMTSAITIPNATTYIGQYAFLGAHSQELTIGEGVTSIGDYAFWNCPYLATVHFNATNCTQMHTQTGSGTTSSPYVYYSVFDSGTSNDGATPIVTLTIGDNVTRIPDYAFRNSPNATGNLTLPSGLTYIGQFAFYYCSGFTGDLVIPNAVTSIDQDAFAGCSGFNGTLTLPINPSFTTINQYTFYSCSGLTGTLTIPANVTTIADYAFEGCIGFNGALILHDAMTTIGAYAFKACSNIDELTIGEGVTSIGGYAFWDCPAMATVHFNATNCTSMVTDSSYSVFNSGVFDNGATSIVTLTIGDNVTRIPNYAFRNSSNMTGDLIIPNSVTSIGTYAFANCSGHNVFTGKNVVSLPDYAFYQSSGFNGTLLFGDALTSIGQYAFQGCNSFTGDLVIPNAVTSMGQYAFSGCSGFNGSLILGNGIQTINQNTFDGCTGFSGALILGTEVNDIKEYAFNNCSAVSLLITENADPITATSSSFTGMTYTIPVYVPDGLVSNYQNATGWNNFTNYIEQYTFWQELDTDNWSDELNWLSMELPGENDVVCIAYNCDVDIDVDVLHVYVYNINDVLTVKSGKILNTAYGIGVVQPSQLVMEDGSQLYNTIPGVCGTLKKTINGYGSGDNGWYTVASPIYGGTSASAIATGNYDLYGYDEPTHYWLNGENADNGITMMNPAQGYLYANQAGTTLNFAGQLNACNANVSIPITYTYSPLAGLNLVGNPFTCNAYLQDENDNPMPFFKMNDTGDALVAAQAGMPIKPCEGVFVFCPNDRQEHFAVFTTTAPANLGEIQDVPDVLLPIHDLLVNQDACGAVSSVTQTITLSEGWNWVSTYIDLNEVNGIAMLEEALGDYGVTIQTYNESADYFGGGEWSGLEDYVWTNAEMIMVEVSEDCTIDLAGPTVVDPSTVEIEIHPGWNWMGFPVATETAIGVAMAGFEAEEEDAIQSNVDGTSDYLDEWVGDVLTLVPGQGYMYYSNSTEPKTLVFSTTAKGKSVITRKRKE